MMKSILITSLIFLVSIIADEANCQEPVDFKTQVLPILMKHCAACHNEEDYEAGFSVDSYDAIEEGCDGEAVFISGDPDKSWMIQLVAGDKEPLMPPDSQPRPTDEEFEILKKWIEEGANDSEANKEKPTIQPPSLVTINRDSPITAVAWSAENVIAVGRFQSIELIDTLKGQSAAAFSPDNRWIAGSGMDNRIRVWKFVSPDSANRRRRPRKKLRDSSQ